MYKTFRDRRNKKDQHFVPSGYLKQFIILGTKSFLWEYDKHNGSISKDPVSRKKSCLREYYYYQKDEDGDIDHTSFENALAEVERKGLLFIQDIQPDFKLGKIRLDEERQGEFAFF